MIRQLTLLMRRASLVRPKSHDLTMEDSALGFNQAAVDLVNERFARQVRIGLIEVLHATPKIGIEKGSN